MTHFKRIAFIVIFAVIAVAVLPFFNGQNIIFNTAASDEIRLTKGAEVRSPALGNNFITWIEYRAGAYNLYAHDFIEQKEIKLNKEAVSVDAVGPVTFQNYVYLADHVANGWQIIQFDVEHGTVKVLKTESNQIESLAAYENYVVYAAKAGTGSDVFLLNKNNFDIAGTVVNLSHDEAYQENPAIYGNLVVWSEFPVACEGISATTACVLSQYGQVVTYDVISTVRTVIKTKIASLSPVYVNNWALAWSELEGSTQVVKIYGYNTGTSFNVSPADYHSYNPVMRGDSVIYFVNKEKGGELELYQFATGKRTTLSWSNAQKLEPTVGFSSRYAAWIDNRMGTNDVYYFDALAAVPQTTTAVYPSVANIDQDADGVIDADELKLGTNVYSSDTDNDGLTDYEEIVRYHTYPTQYDSDGDGISDGEEVNNWLSNPLKFDSNNDGIDDKTSIQQGFNPLADRSQLTVYRTIKLPSVTEEQQEASYLRRALNNYLGYGKWGASQTEWKKISDAYSYGGYNIKEIASYLRGNRNAISFDTLASVWREQQAIARLSQ